MSHFYGELRGKSRTPSTKCGSKDSGIYTHVRSWNKGVEVHCQYDNVNKKNIFKIYMTGGSSGLTDRTLITEFEELDGKH